MKFLSTLALLPALALATKPDPEQISIRSVTHSGSGCPQGSTATSINQDRTVLTIGFDEFQTYIGPGTTIMDRTKNCQLHIQLEYPDGFSFAVMDSVYHGFALLEKGVTSDFISTYYFSANAEVVGDTRTTIEGGGLWAYGQVYTQKDSLPAGEALRSPCGGRSSQLNINNRVSLRSSDSKASGMVTNDDQTLALTQQIHIDWFEC